MAKLSVFVITKNPKDFPGKYVVRESIIGDGEWRYVMKPTVVAVSLTQARASLPPGLVNMGREELDDPVIVESWA